MAQSAPHSLAPAAGFVSPTLSQRAAMFAGIVALHVVLAYFLASGLARTTMERVFEPAKVEFIKDPPKPDDPLPPINPHFVQPKLDPVPVPEGPTQPLDPDPATIKNVGPERVLVPVAPVTPEQPIRLVGKHQLPNSDDFYPPALIRAGIQGATNISVCVDENGKRQGEPTVTQSSGNARLDDSALELARAGRYARSARGETFVPNCYGFRIIFKIR